MDPRKKFRFGESVGRDQLGEVHRAEDSNGNELAIKIFDAWTVESQESREAYARALAILRSLKPRRTPPILGYRIRPENAWLATQWIESKTLSAKLDEVGELNEQETATIACGILDALAELHGSEFAHGGITPNKILLTRDVSAGGVVITDPFQHNLYSVSNPIETLQSEQDRFIGLPEYFSPEQAQGARPDLRSDIYVIGLIIYKMLTGRTPFESGNPSIILKRQIHEQPLPPRLVKPGIEISSELEAIIQQALAKNPDERFDSPRAMRAAIAAVREDFDADSEMAATPLGPYPVDAEVPDADADADSQADAEEAESKAEEANEESEEDALSQPDAPVATAEFAAVDQEQRRHMTETPVALGAVEDDEVSDEADDEDPIQFLDDDEDSPFEDLDQPQAEHSYDGTDDETLEAIEDFATLAAEFDYGFDDEQTNSWFAAGDDAEEMADRHGDELPPSPKESERRHNRAFFLLVPLALIATIAAVLVMSSDNEGEGTEGESADQVAEAEQDEAAEGTAVAETDAGAEDAQEGQAAAAAAGTDAAGADATADAEGEVAEGDAESEPETEEQAQDEEQVAAAAAAEEAEEAEEQQEDEARQAREEEAQERAEAREEREAERAQEEEEAEQQVAAAQEQDSGDSETDAGSSTGSGASAQAAAAEGSSGSGGETADSGSGTSESSGEGTQVAEAEAADPEAEAEAQRQAEEEARQQAEEERRQREEAERQAQRSREIAEEARSALSSGNLDQARRLFNEALTIDSSNTSAHAGLGDTYFRMNEYRRAIPHHQAAGQYRALGMDYFRLNEYPKALQAFERAAAQGDPNAERYVNIVRQRMEGSE
jgi:serine/threonine protein kinase